MLLIAHGGELYMYVYVCICMYIYVYIYKFEYMYLHVYVYIYICKYVIYILIAHGGKTEESPTAKRYFSI
jgi:hypothetical protein